MAFAFTEVCRSVRVTPTQKAVLMCLADFCHDDGKDWHSIAAIQEWTCLGKTAVIDAIKGLESLGLIVIERRFGAKSTTWLQLERLRAAAVSLRENRTAWRMQPVRLADEPVRVANKPVRLADPKH
jgi:pyocin large subunit-like protein